MSRDVERAGADARPAGRSKPAARELAEFVAAWAILKGLGVLPRGLALATGRLVGRTAHRLAGGLRRTGLRNLELAFPEMSPDERGRRLLASFENLGRVLAEFSHFPRLRKPADLDRVLGFENRHIIDRAIESGRGVLFLTGHIGGWELGPFGLRLSGAPPVNFLVRHIDNPRVERLAESYRTLHGNRTIDKRNAAKAVFAALKRGEMVGILADLNTLEREGVFVDFFGIPASTTTGLAAFALRTNAVVIPGYTYWNEREGRYVLRFEEPVEPVRTGSKADDIRETTQRFTAALEAIIRAHPEQWLWIDKRWKTRPPGEEPIY